MNYQKIQGYGWACLLLLAGLTLFYVSCRKTDTEGLSHNFTIFPSSGPAGSLVTLTGNGFGTDITQDSVFFNGLKAQVVNVSPTKLEVYVPHGVTTGAVSVYVNGQVVTGPMYTVSSVSISSLSVTNGLTGDSVAILGLGLSDSGALSQQAGWPVVKFNGKPAAVVSATPTRVVVLVPGKADPGPVTLSIGGDTAAGPFFNYLGIDTIHSVTGNVGTVLTLTGGFGTSPAQDTVMVNGVKATIDSASATRLVITVPAGAATGTVAVRTAGRILPGPVFTFVAAPVVSGIVPSSGPARIKVTVTGTGFSKSLSENSVSFNGVPGTVVSATATQLVVAAPAGVTSGPVVATVNNQTGSGPLFTVQALGISSLSNTYFIPPMLDTIAGVGFSPTMGLNTVQFNGKTVTVVSASDTQLVVNVLAGVSTGTISVQVGSMTAGGPAYSTLAVVTLAGSSYGSVDGQGAQAQFKQPLGLAVDGTGDLFVVDQYSSNIRKITPDGTVVTIAGDPNGSTGFTDGQGTDARFSFPSGIALDKSGNLYVADNNNYAVRKITPGGSVSTFATIPSGNNPGGVALDVSGNVYVTDGGSNSVYEYNPAGSLINTITISDAVQLYGIAVDAAGNVYTTDQSTGNIFKGTQLVVTGPGYDARMITFDNNGNLLMTDYASSQIYLVNPANNYTVTAITGSAYPKNQAGGYMDGPPATARFNQPNGMAVDGYGIIYVGDGQAVVRKISLK